MLGLTITTLWSTILFGSARTIGGSRNKPKIPSEEILNKFIASCGWKYSVVFTLLKETGAMLKKLSEVVLRNIDGNARNKGKKRACKQNN